MTIKNATEFVVLCENRLGYVLDETKEIWKARQIQAGRINKAIAKDPLLTWPNLELAVEYLVRKRQPISSPLYVTKVVKTALQFAAETQYKEMQTQQAAQAQAAAMLSGKRTLAVEARPLADLIDEAIATERSEPALTSQAWIDQLTRAVGKYRQDAYEEWRAERSHLFGS